MLLLLVQEQLWNPSGVTDSPCCNASGPTQSGKRIPWKGKSGISTAYQPLGLPCVSSTLTLMPLHPTAITQRGIELVFLPLQGYLRFCFLLFISHRGPLWINDLLTAPFSRGWGGSRSLCVWNWRKLDLTAAFIHRAVQDPGNMQVVPWQEGKQTVKEKKGG